MFQGIYVALLTPFSQQQIDVNRFTAHIDALINQGIHGVVPCGTTGEAPTLSAEERRILLKACCDTAQGRVPVMAGVGTANTAETVELAKEAEKIGVDALLIISPYYNKPTQNGIFQHYKTIHDQTERPIFLYSNPGRCGTEISIETVARLAELPRIKGLKDASNDISRCIKIRQLVGPDFVQLTGEDAASGAYLAAGGHGCISVSANIAPATYRQLYDAWVQGKNDLFQQKQAELAQLNSVLFCQSNPIPLKYAASVLGICSPEVRLPLTPLDTAFHKSIHDCLKTLGHDL